MDNLNLEAILGMTHSKLGNYILPGLESALLGSKTRLFINTRESIGQITPHNHRFDFQCLVLRGSVENIVFKPTPVKGVFGEEFVAMNHDYDGDPGKYINHCSGNQGFYVREKKRYGVGQWYGMLAHQFHTISFSLDAVVMFIEGPQNSSGRSEYLAPVVDGVALRTMRVEPWMFKKIPD